VDGTVITDCIMIVIYIYIVINDIHRLLDINGSNYMSNRKTPAILNMYSTDIGLWKLMEIVKNTR
jgi:hypothetical protein